MTATRHEIANQVKPGQSIEELGQFDIIVCSLVLLELKQKEMEDLLKTVQPRLNDSGVLVSINCTSKAYKAGEEWYSFNTNFPENKPLGMSKGKPKLENDQPVKLQAFTHSNNTSFTFFDFFHRGGAGYCKAFQEAGLFLSATHKPLGKDSDPIAWKSEKNFRPIKYMCYIKRHS